MLMFTLARSVLRLSPDPGNDWQSTPRPYTRWSCGRDWFTLVLKSHIAQYSSWAIGGTARRAVGTYLREQQCRSRREHAARPASRQKQVSLGARARTQPKRRRPVRSHRRERFERRALVRAPAPHTAPLPWAKRASRASRSGRLGFVRSGRVGLDHRDACLRRKGALLLGGRRETRDGGDLERQTVTSLRRPCESPMMGA